MKRNLITLLLIAMSVQLFAWTSPVTIPDVGGARKNRGAVCCQNRKDG